MNEMKWAKEIKGQEKKNRSNKVLKRKQMEMKRKKKE